METTTSRRALIKAAPLTITALAIPASAVVPTTDRGEWEAALAVCRKASADDDAFMPGFWKAWEACRSECDAVPHTTFPPEAYTGGRCQTTASPTEVAQARREIAQLDAGKMWLEPKYPSLIAHYEVKRDLVKAADARDEQIAAIRKRYDMDRLEDTSEALSDRKCAAWQVLMAIPSPDLAALRWKLNHVTENGTEWAGYSADYTEQLRADIARLLPVEG